MFNEFKDIKFIKNMLRSFIIVAGVIITVGALGYTFYIMYNYGHSVILELIAPSELAQRWNLWLPMLVIFVAFSAGLIILPSGLIRGSLFLLLPGYVLKQAYKFLTLFHLSHGKYNDDTFYTWFFISCKHQYSLEEKTNYIATLCSHFPSIKLTQDQINILLMSNDMKTLTNKTMSLISELLISVPIENKPKIPQAASKVVEYLESIIYSVVSFAYVHPYLVGGASITFVIIGGISYWYISGTLVQNIAESGYLVTSAVRDNLSHLEDIVVRHARERLISDVPTNVAFSEVSELASTTRNALVVNQNNMKFMLRVLSATATLLCAGFAQSDILKDIATGPKTQRVFMTFMKDLKELNRFVLNVDDNLPIDNLVPFPGIGEQLGGTNPDRTAFLASLEKKNINEAQG